jgi:hypothetical protein
MKKSLRISELVMVALAFVMALVPASASAVTYGPFMNSNNGTSLCMSVPNYNNGTKLTQQTCNGAFLTQHWIHVSTGINDMGSPTYTIRPNHSQGKCVTIENGSNGVGAKAVLSTCAGSTGTSNQRFSFIYNPYEYGYRTMAMHSHLFLQVDGGPDAGPGAYISQWSYPVPGDDRHFFWASSVY